VVSLSILSSIMLPLKKIVPSIGLFTKGKAPCRRFHATKKAVSFVQDVPMLLGMLPGDAQ
jgi:hypothetical protein